VLSDGVAGNCIVYHNGKQLMYLATWKEYTTPNFGKFRVLENRTQEVVLQKTSIWRTKLLVSSMKRVQDFSRTKVFDDIVGDLKIDALYIFDKALLTTHHFVVLKDDVIM
jgi:hypothetical protein